jgi:hypothetical protein
VEGLLFSVSQAINAEFSVPAPPAGKRGWKSCVDLRFSHRGNWWSNGAAITCSCTCFVCGKRNQAWQHIATHVNKVESSEMVYVISKTQQQCHVCHKMFPSDTAHNWYCNLSLTDRSVAAVLASGFPYSIHPCLSVFHQTTTMQIPAPTVQHTSSCHQKSYS